jgi:hypothetical protein
MPPATTPPPPPPPTPPPPPPQAEHYKWSSEDVRRQVEERRQRGAAPVNLAVERIRLTHLVEAAGADAEARDRWGSRCWGRCR